MYLFFAALAGLIHVYIFVMESLLWGTPKVNKAFGVSRADAETNRTFAYNQGFYNLFLALGLLTGVGLAWTEFLVASNTLILFTCLCMLGASLVLFSSAANLVRPALIQGLPPFLAILFLWI